MITAVSPLINLVILCSKILPFKPTPPFSKAPSPLKDQWHIKELTGNKGERDKDTTIKETVIISILLYTGATVLF